VPQYAGAHAPHRSRHPLRLPAIVEADDDGLYVLKFRGAGHGAKALVAELLAGELARAAGLPVPEVVFAELDQDLARTEPDPEIHALIHDSAGLNVALDYLPGSVNFDPVVHKVPPDLASRVVWFDAFVSNVDRTPRNTNMLMWHGALWLIDQGSALYFHHAPEWHHDAERPHAPFEHIRDHVLLRQATRLDDADREMAAALSGDVIESALRLLPDAWLEDADASASSRRAAYGTYLTARLAGPRRFVEEAARVR
jgi:hypothetical protein